MLEPLPQPGLPRPRLLRLSVTERCNFRCHYCMPAEKVERPETGEPLSFERTANLVAFLARTVGVDHVKLTGGEPLVREGIASLVARLAAVPGIREISMTTNGSRLAGLARPLRDAGLARVNVSLDALDGERFTRLTRGGRLPDTIGGIEAAQAAGLRPLKINAVLQRATWREDVPQLIAFGAERGLEVRFIELMRTGTERTWCASQFVPAHEVRAFLAADGDVVDIAGHANAPARRTRVRFRGQDAIVGWITPQSHSFCDACERLRIDARGRLRRCLFDQCLLPLPELLERHGDGGARTALAAYLAGKRPPAAMDLVRPMSAVGG